MVRSLGWTSTEGKAWLPDMLRDRLHQNHLEYYLDSSKGDNCNLKNLAV